MSRIHVSNLSWAVDDEALKAKFASIGAIDEAHVVTAQRNGRSKGFGFVSFASADAAQQAVDEFAGTDFEGRDLRVGISTSTGVKTSQDFPDSENNKRTKKPRRQRKAAKDAPEPIDAKPGCRLYVSNISWDTTDDLLKENFEAYGAVLEARVVRSHSGRSRGFAFITFDDAAEASEAQQKLHGVPIDSREITVEIATTIGPVKAGDQRRLYVSGLSPSVDDVQLEALFTSFGEVTQARVVFKKEDGASAGFGFVTMADADVALTAVEGVNGTIVDDSEITVEVAKGRRRRTRRNSNEDA